MDRAHSRRKIIKGGLAAGIGLALPTRVFASEGVPPDALLPGIVPGEGVAPLAGSFQNSLTSVPAAPTGLTLYERRVMAVASKQAARVRNHLWRADVVGIVDFDQPSWKPRLHFANLENGTLRSFLVAHGRGSDPAHSGWLQSFSNVPGSEATSRGAYLTAEWYKGKYGTSIRLVGLDNDNSMALPRAIVMHPAWYVAQNMIDKWGKLGRSEGCFAMSDANFNEALWHLSGGRLLFADRIGEG
ncbi:murein L,D-transpeptidase catalytic domain-containing protein [Novosphingobium guangzhouense]|uniref:Twin-arginine translocation pathway signal n=1 Tax=Novosphingobium guangzhouense TaxID=1850347 RepID=A0A2K2G4K4_9SPHN|nr:murein L,D-transpeptidase catalytic domain family protein [Novosphingobium guangzhouense]PNU05969.1 twin-arginine translocation pathway signal [Novosphingobium guangzhouense]